MAIFDFKTPTRLQLSNQLQLHDMPGDNKFGIIVLQAVDTSFECWLFLKLFVMSLDTVFRVSGLVKFIWSCRSEGGSDGYSFTAKHTSTDFQLISNS